MFHFYRASRISLVVEIRAHPQHLERYVSAFHSPIIPFERGLTYLFPRFPLQSYLCGQS